MNFLDLRTIVFSNLLTDVICLLMIVFLWRQNRRRFAGTLFWVFGYTCQVSAMVLIVLRGAIPDWASIVLANTLVVAGALLGYMGLLRFIGKRHSQVFNYVFLAAMVLVHVYFTFVRPDVEARSANTSLGLLVMTVQCAWLLLYTAPKNIRKMTLGIGLVFTVFSLINFGRILHYFIFTPIRKDFFEPNTMDALSLIAYQILFLSLTYSLALVYNKRLIGDMQAEEEKFSRMFRSSPYAVALSRLSDGRMVEVNDAFLKITGYNEAELKNQDVLNLHIWRHDEDRLGVVHELIKNDRAPEKEFQYRTKSGEEHTALFAAELVTVDNERCVLSIINDITDRKKMEETLRETTNYLNSLINYANAPIITWDAHYIITRFNHAFERMTGYPESEMVGNELQILFPQASRDESLHMIDRTSSGEFWESVEIPIKRKDGEIRTALWNSANIFDLAGQKIITTIAQGQDITDRKQAQEEISRLNLELEKKVAERTADLRATQVALLNVVDDVNSSANKLAEANKSLETANRELEAFSYSVSHDLRAPLRSIDGFSQALLEDYHDKLDGEGRNYLERVRKATQHMGRLIDDMLKLARVTRAEFKRETVDLSRMVTNITQRDLKNDPNREVDVHVQDGLCVLADHNLMEIVLVNLIDNAWKFTGKTPHPKIEFGVMIRDEKTIFFVRDNGVGFDMAYADKLFGTFQRLHTMEEFPGTGIGLATVRRIITRHGGEIWAESEIGKGATFFFTLPA